MATENKFIDLEAVNLAMKFHEIYERLAPQFGYETREETRQFDPDSSNGKLMIAVCREVLDQYIVTFPGMTMEAFSSTITRAMRKAFRYD